MAYVREEEDWRRRSDEDSEPDRGRRGDGRGGWRDQGREDCFTLMHFKRYEGEAPKLLPPTVLGSFSVDSEKNIHFDDSMLPVLSKKFLPDGESMKVDLDLNQAWHRVNNFTGTSYEGFKNILQWIIKNQEKVRAKDASDRLEADFVCSRRLLKQIMWSPYTLTPYNLSEWVLLARYFKGTIYMISEHPEEKKNKEKEGCSLPELYGHKFEQYMTGGDPEDVLESDCQFRCVLQLCLDEMKLLFAPDTDAVDPTLHKKDFKDMSSFVRLKLRLEPKRENTIRNFKRHSLSTWWIENKLTGVPRLLMGLRNPEGVVHTLKMLNTDDLPTMAEGEWDPSVPLNVLDKFLNFVKTRVIAEPDMVHCFERCASDLRKIWHSSYPINPDILPNWYKKELFATQDED